MDISALSNAGITQTKMELQRQESMAESFQDTLNKAAAGEDDAKLREACREFESYFINVMFREMRKTVDTSSSFIPVGYAENVFQEMLDEETSKNAAKSGGIGLADMMYRQMNRATAVKAEES